MDPENYQIRKIVESDIQTLFKWATDPETRALSLHPEPILWDTHVEWFEKKINSSDASYWILEDLTKKPIGLVRFDFKGQTALISFNLDASERGQGLGALILAFGMDAVTLERGKVTFCAWVDEDNAPSIKSFLKNGFVPTGIELMNGKSFQVLQRESD